MVARVPDDVAATLTPGRRAPHPRPAARVLPAQGRHRQRLERPPAGRGRRGRGRDGRLHPRPGPARPARSTCPSRSTPSSRPSSRTCGRSAPSAVRPGPTNPTPTSSWNLVQRFRNGERRWSRTCTIDLGPRRCAAARAVAARRNDWTASAEFQPLHRCRRAGIGPSGNRRRHIRLSQARNSASRTGGCRETPPGRAPGSYAAPIRCQRGACVGTRARRRLLIAPAVFLAYLVLGVGPAGAQETTTTVAGASPPTTVATVAGPAVGGRLVDRDGEPVEGAELEVAPGRRGDRSGDDERRTASGRSTVPEPDTSYSVTLDVDTLPGRRRPA